MLAKGSVFFCFINKYWANSKHVSLSPLSELSLDLSRPVIYIIEQNSASDLLARQSSYRLLGLPELYQPLNTDGNKLSAILYLYPCAFFLCWQKKAKDVRYLKQRIV